MNAKKVATVLVTSLLALTCVAEDKPRKLWQNAMVDEYFLFSAYQMAMGFDMSAKAGALDPFADHAYMLSNEMKKPATLGDLVEKYGEPEKKQVVVDKAGKAIQRWWWGPVAFEAASAKDPITAHGLDTLWINKLNHDDPDAPVDGSGLFGPIEGGAANVAPGRFAAELKGGNTLRINNPNAFGVNVMLRAGSKGVDFAVQPKSAKTIEVPDGNYSIFFTYTNRKGELYQGESFALNKYGIELKITEEPTGNYRIRRVK